VSSRAAEIQVLLEGVPLPATTEELLRYARGESADAATLARLEALPDREYASLDEVGETLHPVQPSAPKPQPRVPNPESNLPPGGEAYTDPSAEPPAADARRLRRPRAASSAAPPSVHPSATCLYLPASPFEYGSPIMPSRFSITLKSAFSTSTPPTASRRAGVASAGGTAMTAAAPALATALDPNTNGNSRRASCQTGIAVSEISVAV
jgi:hypothetical protein